MNMKQLTLPMFPPSKEVCAEAAEAKMLERSANTSSTSGYQSTDSGLNLRATSTAQQERNIETSLSVTPHSTSGFYFSPTIKSTQNQKLDTPTGRKGLGRSTASESLTRAGSSALSLQEEWRKVPGIPDYEISSFGNIRSYKPYRNNAPTPLEPRPVVVREDKDGYRRVNLYKGGSPIEFRISSLVATAWHGPRPDGMVVRHLDGDRTNDSPENLRWGSHKENSADMALHGTVVNGEAVNTAKLDNDTVLAIRSSNASTVELAALYGVTPSTISHIRLRRTWKHI